MPTVTLPAAATITLIRVVSLTPTLIIGAIAGILTLIVIIFLSIMLVFMWQAKQRSVQGTREQARRRQAEEARAQASPTIITADIHSIPLDNLSPIHNVEENRQIMDNEAGRTSPRGRELDGESVDTARRLGGKVEEFNAF